MAIGHVVNMKGERDKWQYGEHGLSGRALLSPALGNTDRFHIVQSEIFKIILQF